MQKIKSFVFTAILGGVTLILPIAIIWMVFSWIFKKITSAIDPLTHLMVARGGLHPYWADLLVILIIVIFCFLIGLFERTQLGKVILVFFENNFLGRIPGYGMVKETILYFMGENVGLFSSVALVQLFGNEVKATAFITDEHEDGSFTVFIPTGPNPTSGLIYHLPGKFVQKVSFPVDQTLRSIISCGAGSKNLFKDEKARRAVNSQVNV